MTRILRSSMIALGLCVVAIPFAYAEPCQKLVGKTMCFHFSYSSPGLKNTYTGHFGVNNTFTFPDVPGTTGTYACAGGKGLTEVNYMFGGFEQQQWNAQAGLNGQSMDGFGKSITNGYMYKLTGTQGRCPASADELARQPGANQSE